MSEMFDEEMVEETNHFVIEDDQTAEWAMGEIRNAEAEKKKWKDFYDDRYQKVCASCDLKIANMESFLQTYFEKVPHKVTKTQENYALPSGKLVIKKQQPEYTRDDAALVAWLKENDGERFIVTKETVDWMELKKTLNILGDTVADANGQIIPCITVEERPDVFKVELKKEG